MTLPLPVKHSVQFGKSYVPFLDRLHASKFSLILFILCLISFYAALQAIFFPRRPHVLSLDPNYFTALLRKNDPSVISLPSLPAVRTHELALSEQLRWRIKNGYELTLVHASVRQEQSFQAAFIARDDIRLWMPKPRYDYPVNGTNYGFILGRKSFQTCYVSQSPLPDFGAKHSALINSHNAIAPNSWSSLMQYIGLQPRPSYDCILVTLRASSNQILLRDTWNQILSQMRHSKVQYIHNKASSALLK